MESCFIDIKTEADDRFLKEHFDTSWIDYRSICEKEAPYTIEYDAKEELLFLVSDEYATASSIQEFVTIQELEAAIFTDAEDEDNATI